MKISNYTESSMYQMALGSKLDHANIFLFLGSLDKAKILLGKYCEVIYIPSALEKRAIFENHISMRRSDWQFDSIKAFSVQMFQNVGLTSLGLKLYDNRFPRYARL